MDNTFMLPNIAIKTKGEIREAWCSLIDETDDFISKLLRCFDIDVERVYTTNVGMLSVETEESSTILWDLSYVSLYRKYIDFVYWMEKANAKFSKDSMNPAEMKYQASGGTDCVSAHRVCFLGTIFDYLSKKFYSNDALSYCFALLHNQNNCLIAHPVSDEENIQYNAYMFEQLTVMKMFWAFHEAHHLGKIKLLGGEDYKNRILYNIKAIVNSVDFSKSFGYDLDLVNAVRLKIKSLKLDDPLFEELFADAGALDYVDFVINYMHIFGSRWTLEKFARITKEAIENFYAFNTLLYELFCIWDLNLEKATQKITDEVYDAKIRNLDIDDVIRSCLFPVILCTQVDLYFSQRKQPIPLPFRRHVNVRKEMIDLFDLAFNDQIKDAIISAVQKGFCPTTLSIQEARDVLIGWDLLEKFPQATEADLFLKGVHDENNFYMFVRGY